jgi:hypothetical protein
VVASSRASSIVKVNLKVPVLYYFLQLVHLLSQSKFGSKFGSNFVHYDQSKFLKYNLWYSIVVEITVRSVQNYHKRTEHVDTTSFFRIGRLYKYVTSFKASMCFLAASSQFQKRSANVCLFISNVRKKEANANIGRTTPRRSRTNVAPQHPPQVLLHGKNQADS